MPSPDKCPFCGSRKIFPAQFFSDGSVGTFLRFPEIKQFPWWKFASARNDDVFRDVGVDYPTACLACGMLWAKYNLPKTLELVQHHGSPEIQALLVAMDAPSTDPPSAAT